jgi:hypothetical protein
LAKKTEGQKSRDTVPLKEIFKTKILFHSWIIDHLKSRTCSQIRDQQQLCFTHFAGEFVFLNNKIRSLILERKKGKASTDRFFIRLLYCAGIYKEGKTW